VRGSTRLVKPSNSGKAWTGEDDDALLQMYNQNKGIKLLAAHFGRSQTAIRKRLEFLGISDNLEEMPF
jgi:hypothetical protein